MATNKLVLPNSMRDFNTNQEPFPGAGFTYEDDVWDLNEWMTSSGSPSDNKLSFEAFPSWIKTLAKAHLAWGWLAREYSISWLQTRLVCLRYLTRYLSNHRPEISQLAQLDLGVAEGFVLYLQDNTSPRQANTMAKRAGDFARWVRRQYQIPINFRPENFAVKPNEKPENSLTAEDKVIPTEVMEQLMTAVSEQHNLLWGKWVKGPPSRRPTSSDLLYLQVIKLMASTPLRISQILLLPRIPLRESVGNEESGVWLSFNETKTHQGLKEKYIPEELAGIVREAINVILEITEPLAVESGSDLLFLRRSRGVNGGSVQNISVSSFTMWLNGRHDEEGNVLRQGFIHRHKIKYHGYYYTFTPHQTRHTAATRIYLGGGGFGTANEYLDHRSIAMTGVYVHGRKRDISELKEALDQGRVIGKTVPILQDREVFVGELSEADLEYYKSSGMYIQLTPYGFCTRPAKRGPCPHPHPCWRGPQNDSCESALLLPRGLEQMERDMELVQKQVELWETDYPESPFLSNVRSTKMYYDHLRNQLGSACESSDYYQPTKETKETGISSNGEKKLAKVFPRKKNSRTDYSGFLDKRHKVDSFINGKSEADRIREVYDQLIRLGSTMTDREFANLAKVSISRLKEHHPEAYKALVKVRMNYKKNSEVSRIEEEWNRILEIGVAPNISDFAKRCAIDRNRLYTIYPDWSARIKQRYKESLKARENEKIRNKVEKEKGEIESRDRITNRVEDLWSALQYSRQSMSIEDFAKTLGIHLRVLYRDYPYLVGQLKDWHKVITEEIKKNTYEERFKKEWISLQESKEKITMTQFAKRCGVGRNTIYSKYPHWADQIQNYIKDGRDYHDLIEEEFALVQSSGKKVPLFEFAERCGIHRNVLYTRYPELVERLAAFNENIR